MELSSNSENNWSRPRWIDIYKSISSQSIYLNQAENGRVTHLMEGIL